MQAFYLYLLRPYGGNRIAYCDILHSAISQILQITVVHHSQRTVIAEGKIPYRTWEISIGIFRAPYLAQEIAWNER